jgi:hypothetical protein
MMAIKSIVKNGLWVQYSCEDVSFLKPLLGEDWDPRVDDIMAADTESAKEEKDNREGQRGVDDRYKVYIPMACFCDIPHSRIDNHAGDEEDYGPYAVVFQKEWGRQRGVNPVSYVVSESDSESGSKSDFAVAFQNFEALTDSIDKEDECWQIRSVFRKLLQFLKPYEEEKRYYDEREWRYIPKGAPTLYPKSKFESQHICQLHSTLCATFDDIECLIVKENSEIEEVNTFLREDLNGDADKVSVCTFEEVKENGVK